MVSAMTMGGKRSEEHHNWTWIGIISNALRNKGGTDSWDGNTT